MSDVYGNREAPRSNMLDGRGVPTPTGTASGSVAATAARIMSAARHAEAARSGRSTTEMEWPPSATPARHRREEAPEQVPLPAPPIHSGVVPGARRSLAGGDLVPIRLVVRVPAGAELAVAVTADDRGAADPVTEVLATDAPVVAPSRGRAPGSRVRQRSHQYRVLAFVGAVLALAMVGLLLWFVATIHVV